MYAFLCYSSYDKLAARALYDRLSAYIWIRTWFEFGTQRNIEEVVQNLNPIILLLSKESVSNKGYAEDLFVRTLHQIDEMKKQETNRLLVIPLRLNDCTIPRHLEYLPWTDYFAPVAQEKLVNTIQKLYLPDRPLIYAVDGITPSNRPDQFPIENQADFYEKFDWHQYVHVPESTGLNYSFLIRKFQVTTEQFMDFLRADDYADEYYWMNFPKFDENCKWIGDWGTAGLDWLKRTLKNSPSLLEQRLNWVWRKWQTAYDFRQPNHPAVLITWFEANAYCKWFSKHWHELPNNESLSSLITQKSTISFRLPLETELHAALKYSAESRAEIDPTGRHHKGLGLSIDEFQKDMLANLYGGDLKRYKSLACCYGLMYIDQNESDKTKLSARGSLHADENYSEYGFRVLATESQGT